MTLSACADSVRVIYARSASGRGGIYRSDDLTLSTAEWGEVPICPLKRGMYGGGILTFGDFGDLFD